MLAAMLCLLLSGPAHADIDLLGPDMKWSANINSGTTTTEVGQSPEAPLTVKIVSDGGPESYPKVRLTWPAGQDWSSYGRLSGRVRVTTNRPSVPQRELAICVYDSKTLRMDLPDHPMTQQAKSHYFQVGEWTNFTDWIIDMKRSSVVMLDLYMHERVEEPGLEYTFEFAKLNLIGGADAFAFDTVFYPRGSQKRATSNPRATVTTDDGLGLTIGTRGDVWLSDGAPVTDTGIGSGLLVRDVTSDAPPTVVGGTLSKQGDALHQISRLEKLGLQVDATYRRLGDCIEVAGAVTDMRGEDRAVTVTFAVPTEGDDWVWWDGPAAPVPAGPGTGEHAYLEAGMEYGLSGVHSYYPLGAVTRAGKEGLSLAVRMDEPVIHRIGFSPDASRFYISADFGLAHLGTVHGKSLATAPFRFLLYRHDPAQGFRSAIQRYYDMFPQFFPDRFANKGGWLVWGKVQDTPGALEGGLRLHWGPSGAEAVKYDNENGVTPVQYIEAEYFQETMGDFDRAPTAVEGIERLKKLEAGDEKEMAAFEKLGYASSYLPGTWIRDHGLRAQIQAVARAAVASAYYTETGIPHAMIGQYPWMQESKWGVIFPCNLDPDIPGGKGRFASDLYLPTGLKDMTDAGAHYDGIGLDSLGGYGQWARANFRREHFQYVDSPLSFSASSHRPVQPAWFGTVEWLKELDAQMHGQGLVLMANCSWNFAPGWLTFAGPYLDIFGAEATSFGDPYFARFVARQRNLTDLPYSPRPEPEVAWHALLNIFAGHGNDTAVLKKYDPTFRALAAAGWEPLTHATAEPADVKLERFGTGDKVYLVLSIFSGEAREATVTVDTAALGWTGFSAANADTGAAVAVEGNRLTLPLEKDGTVVLALTRK